MSILNKVKRLHQQLNGSTLELDLDSYQIAVDQITGLESTLKQKNDIELQKLARHQKQRCQQGTPLDDLLPTTFALVREAARRQLELRAYDEQLIAGMAMHQGKLAEMQTGEGKTLSAVFPACLNALSGQSVHILTFNDYLARRDARWMEPVYEFMGLTVGHIQEGMSIPERQQAYAADITYITAKEAGFDFLRDSLCYNRSEVVQQPFHYAIVDEADSILIDEARIPLIIAGAADDYVAHSCQLAQIARQFRQGTHFITDEYARNINLSDEGVACAEEILDCGNLYDIENLDTLTRLNCALHAEHLLVRDVDYIVRDGKIEQVDEFTGRVADGRRWPDGLQAAIEAKENISIQSKGEILNSITMQNFVQLYPKIAGMTATAQAAEEEFRRFYNLDIVVIPPNQPCIREDLADVIFTHKAAKHDALVEEIIRVHWTKRPVLVGTRSVSESFAVAGALKKAGVTCEVLNAVNDALEAEIIAKAGQLGAVTISTNMAGRGTDIRLGGVDDTNHEKVVALGGLYVIGTNKHESLRIDQQLRGRAGRQGDPGASRFFISLEDDLFVKYKIRDLIAQKYYPEQQTAPIEHPAVQFEANRVQRIIEGQNLEIKKTLNKYSTLIEQQRQIIFNKRKEFLNENSIMHFFEIGASESWKKLRLIISNEELKRACRQIGLMVIDKQWSQYLADIADIREGIHLKNLGGQNPLLEFHKLAIELFDALQENIDTEMLTAFNRIEITENGINPENAGLKAPSATWTYLINDNPFENLLGIQIMGNMGLAIGAGIYGPLMVAFSMFNKWKKKGWK